MARRNVLQLAAYGTALACGPASSEEPSDVGSGSTSLTTVETDSASESTSDNECPDIFAGDLIIREATDVAQFARLGMVAGDLRLVDTAHEDLRFLACLSEVSGTINITRNENLRTLVGLEHLSRAGEIWLTSNPKLQSARALDGVESLDGLIVLSSPALSELGLNSLTSIDMIQLGDCGVDPDEVAPGIELSLTEIDGFANLETARYLRIAGQYALESLGPLLDVQPPPGGSGSDFFNNHSLPYEEVETILGRFGGNSCGNFDDPDPLCSESRSFAACIAPPP